MEITNLIFTLMSNGASDMHLCPNSPPMCRINGDVKPMSEEVLSAEDVKLMIYSVMTEAQQALYEKDYEIDFAVQFNEESRFRVNAYNTIEGNCAAFRVIPTKILSFDEINAPESVRKLANLKKGLVLVTGPTGSGKSTTLASIINQINKDHEKHILTIEDPVEFVHKSNNSIINQRELNTSTHSFTNALKSALREDPDVILVGELRDLETIQLAVSAAETGHLVFGTLHTNSASKTIDRVIDVFPSSEKSLIRAMLSTSIEAIISQVLLKSPSGGRVAVHEILLGLPAIRNLIREGKTAQINSIMQVSSKHGMITFKERITELLEQGKITTEIATNALTAFDFLEDNS